MEGFCIDLLERISSDIIVSVAGRGVEALGADTGFLHGVYYFQLVVFGGLVDFFKALLQSGKNLFAVFVYRRADAECGVNFIHCTHGKSFRYLILVQPSS